MGAGALVRGYLELTHWNDGCSTTSDVPICRRGSGYPAAESAVASQVDEGRTRPGGSPLTRAVASPLHLTIALIAALSAAGVLGFRRLPPEPLMSTPGGATALVLVVMLAVGFLVTELGQALVEFRDHAYSFSLSGIPLLLGLLYVPPEHLVLARASAAVLAFAIQRTPPIKGAFNTANYLLDTVLVVLLTHRLVGADAALAFRPALVIYLCLVVVDLLMSALVLLAIRINDGPLTRADAVAVSGPATAFVTINTAIGFVFAVLASADELGVVLLVVVAGFTFSAYRAYLVLRRRHRSLQVVQEFIESSEGDDEAVERAVRLLDQIRGLVRASRVELTVTWEDGRRDRHRTHDAPHDKPAGDHAEPPAPLSVGMPDDAALIDARTQVPAHRAWLDDHGVRHAAIVRLTRDGAAATLVAVDRLGGDAETFTDDDLALMHALTGHLLVALRNTQLVDELRHDATHDSLTGLANRALLTDRLRQGLAEGHTGCESSPHCATSPGVGSPAVLLLDLDRFKEVNDTLGHHVGDQLLQVVAHRLKALALGEATIARLGGDEFAVLLPAATPQIAVEVADLIEGTLTAPIELLDATISAEASIGVALAGSDHTDADVLRHADTAMYAAKRDHAGPVVYRPELDAGRAERLALLADLHEALDADALAVHYQPKLHLTDDTISSVEALVRWSHPALGPLRPDVFIPLAESTGLIDRLTRSVLAQALQQCRRWHDDGLDLAVAVNLSARNLLDHALHDTVTAALTLAGVPANQLTLEITESAVMGDPQRTIPTLERLAASGISLSLDDFGTGYSSLSYLQRLPVHEVKIDQSFIRGLSNPDTRPASLVLVKTIIGLGTSLGLRVVAEGVEDATILGELRDLGCHTAQGYHISRPLPAAELQPRLHSSTWPVRQRVPHLRAMLRAQ